MGISSIAFALNPYPYSVFKASENRCEVGLTRMQRTSMIGNHWGLKPAKKGVAAT
jgi:hypothetical protein